MDTVWGGYVGRQESQSQWPGCRMGYWKQEGAQWTGNLLYAEGILCNLSIVAQQHDGIYL